MSVDVKKYNFGIIGMGFLGNAITHGFGLHAHIKAYDKFLQGYDSLDNVIDHSDFIWMCLPTPMDLGTGDIDLGILEENVGAIHDRVDESSNKVIIIKSTVIPGTTRMLAKKYPKLEFIMNPEFLTARNNKLDFICASRIIIGNKTGMFPTPGAKLLKEVYEYRFGNSVPIYECGWEEAELTKYAANCFFTIKVSYFNFLYSMCEKLDLDFDEVRDMVLADNRIARSHANVPGWDGQRGYSGPCFPKDINALIQFAKKIGVDPELLEASWSQNLKDRPSKDWEHIPSAVSKK
jgi:UDPglucose 6-dehydrogenase